MRVMPDSSVQEVIQAVKNGADPSVMSTYSLRYKDTSPKEVDELFTLLKDQRLKMYVLINNLFNYAIQIGSLDEYIPVILKGIFYCYQSKIAPNLLDSGMFMQVKSFKDFTLLDEICVSPEQQGYFLVKTLRLITHNTHIARLNKTNLIQVNKTLIPVNKYADTINLYIKHYNNKMGIQHE